MILRRAASPASLLQVPTPSPDVSPCPSIFSAPSVASWGDEDAMSVSAEQTQPSRPVSAVPSKIPTLRDILASRSVPPYTLSAFTAYLSQKQCLENLEFTMDAQRYAQQYDEIATTMIGMPMSGDVDECRDLCQSWQRLINTYISNGAPREVNLPDHIRRNLLLAHNPRGSLEAPPSPEILERAVEHIYELMDESVMMGFLSEMAPKAASSYSSMHGKQVALNDLGISGLESDEDRKGKGHMKLGLGVQGRNRSRSRHKYSPELQSGSETSLHRSEMPMQPPPISTSTTSVGLSTTTGRRSMGSASGSVSGDPMALDESSQPSSPSDMMTPPTTPPGADFGSGGSPRTRNENAFRNMMRKLGGKKRSASRMDR